MQRSLNAVDQQLQHHHQQQSPPKHEPTNLCRIHAPTKSFTSNNLKNKITTKNTNNKNNQIVIQKSETFHVNVNDEKRGFDENLLQKSENNAQQLRQNLIETKSDYSLLTLGHQRKRTLYENYDEIKNYESKPLLVNEDEENVVVVNHNKNNDQTLIYTKKNSENLLRLKRPSLPAVVVKSSSNRSGGITNRTRHSWYAPVYGALEEETEQNFKVS